MADIPLPRVLRAVFAKGALVPRRLLRQKPLDQVEQAILATGLARNRGRDKPADVIIYGAGVKCLLRG